MNSLVRTEDLDDDDQLRIAALRIHFDQIRRDMHTPRSDHLRHPASAISKDWNFQRICEDAGQADIAAGFDLKAKGAPQAGGSAFFIGSLRMALYCRSSASAWAATFSAVKPNFSNTVPPGAEAPKPSMPITLPAVPT